MSSVRSIEEIGTFIDGVDHAEGVAWYDGRIWIGDETGRVIVVDEATRQRRIAAETGGFSQGIAINGAGRCYLCESNLGRVLRLSVEGEVENFVDTVEDQKLQRPNFPVFQRDGTLWVSESGTGWATGDGFLWRRQPEREPEIMARDCGLFTNGLAIDAAEIRIYVVESVLPGVVSYELRGNGIGPRTIVATLPGVVPDGLAFDVEGNLYVACWRPDEILRVRPNGRVETYFEDPQGMMLKGPTNLAFVGDDLGTVLVPEFGGWTLRSYRAEVPGQPLAYPDVV